METKNINRRPRPMVVNKKAVANIGADTVRNFSRYNSATRNAIGRRIIEMAGEVARPGAGAPSAHRICRAPTGIAQRTQADAFSAGGAERGAPAFGPRRPQRQCPRRKRLIPQTNRKPSWHR